MRDLSEVLEEAKKKMDQAKEFRSKSQTINQELQLRYSMEPFVKGQLLEMENAQAKVVMLYQSAIIDLFDLLRDLAAEHNQQR